MSIDWLGPKLQGDRDQQSAVFEVSAVSNHDCIAYININEISCQHKHQMTRRHFSRISTSGWQIRFVDRLLTLSDISNRTQEILAFIGGLQYLVLMQVTGCYVNISLSTDKFPWMDNNEKKRAWEFSLDTHFKKYPSLAFLKVSLLEGENAQF